MRGVIRDWFECWERCLENFWATISSVGNGAESFIAN